MPSKLPDSLHGLWHAWRATSVIEMCLPRKRSETDYDRKSLAHFNAGAKGNGRSGAGRAVPNAKLSDREGSENEPARAGGSARLGRRIFDEVMRGSA
jgi:hypothetical protein